MEAKPIPLTAIRGMNDILPIDTPLWQYFEAKIREIAASYGYQEIRMPIVEKTELFVRSIGEVTDIVEKEMYTFLDRNGDSLTLRPEGTAQCVRAVLENGLIHNQSQRLWYTGPMFRHERPQKGRYRQFYQVGVEAFGLAGPEIDAEQILMMARLWKVLGIQSAIRLEINSLGTLESRQKYKEICVTYFRKHISQLDDDSKRRLETNPLRILDSKNPDMAEVIQKAPSLLDYLDEPSRAHFEGFKRVLENADIQYTVNPRLVRGLDYYCQTVYEWITDDIGAQGTVCAGGRYDGLVTMMGGKPTPCVGFAMGIERILLLIHKLNPMHFQTVDVSFLFLTQNAILPGLKLAEMVRDHISHIRILMEWDGSAKSQFKRADKSGAKLALILGEEELANNTISVKFLREDMQQITIEQSSLVAFLLGHS